MASVRELSQEEMEEAVRKKGKPLNFHFEEAVKVLQEYKEKGERVIYNFNGWILDSENITMDGAYKQITGKTKAEYEKAEEANLEKEQANLEKEQAEERAWAEQRIPEWLERGEKLIPADKKKAWEEHVKRNATDKFSVVNAIEKVLTVMEKVASGTTQEELEELLAEQGHTGFSYQVMRSTIKEFLGQDIAKVEDYKVTSKDLALTSKERVGEKMIRKVKELFSRIRHHDTDIGGR